WEMLLSFPESWGKMKPVAPRVMFLGGYEPTRTPLGCVHTLAELRTLFFHSGEDLAEPRRWFKNSQSVDVHSQPCGIADPRELFSGPASSRVPTDFSTVKSARWFTRQICR